MKLWRAIYIPKLSESCQF